MKMIWGEKGGVRKISTYYFGSRDVGKKFEFSEILTHPPLRELMNCPLILNIDHRAHLHVLI